MTGPLGRVAARLATVAFPPTALAAQAEPPAAPPADWAALTAAGFRVLAIDRLGYGRSFRPLVHYDLHIPARNTRALLDSLGMARAAVVGHSMGGMVELIRFLGSDPAAPVDQGWRRR